MKKLVVTFAVFAVAIVLATNVAYPQNLINGSFEFGVDPNTDPVEQAVLLTARDTTSILGWTVSSGTVDYIGRRWVCGDGTRCLDLAGISPGTISQNVGGFAPGVSYRLSFLMAPSPEDGNQTQSVQVVIGSLSQIFSATGIGTRENLGWTERTFDFTATGTNIIVSFTSLEPSVFGPALDDVRIVPILDLDGDGAPNDIDFCPGTPAGAIVDHHGCSLEQLAPCAGPQSGGSWRNHGQYVSAVAKAANAFLKAGLLTAEGAAAAVQSAARSNCGKK